MLNRNIKIDLHIHSKASAYKEANGYVDESKIENIVKEGIEKGEIKKGDPNSIASEIYGLICSALVYKVRNEKELDIMSLYKEFENTVIEGLRVK